MPIKEPGDSPRINKSEIWAVVFIGISIFLLVSIISFNPRDFPLVQYPPQTPPKNYAGNIGVYVSGTLIFLFGLGSYILIGILGAWGWNKFKEKAITRSNMAGFSILLLVSCTLLDFIKIRWDVLFQGPGGLIGHFLADLTSRYLGTPGGFIILGIFFLLSVLLTTDISLKSFAARKKSRAGAKEAVPVHTDGAAAARPAPPPEIPKKTEPKQPGTIPVIFGQPAKTKKPVQPKFEFMDDLYEPPPLNLLAEPEAGSDVPGEELQESARVLVETLNSFGVAAKVTQISRGPVITRFEVQPASGVKVSSITNLSNDLALSLAVPSVRLEAPIPGKSVVGIEVPNKVSDVVYLRSVIEHESYTQTKSPLIFCLGKSVEGTPMAADLEDMPHVLVAGATGSGKSVFVYSLILSLLYRNGPADLRFVMVDPKRVELSAFEGIPHLMLPVIKDTKEAGSAMKWVVKEMESRYDAFLEKGVHNIKEFNQSKPALPYLVVIIDELADLMIVAPLEIEDRLCRLAQMGRAVGIHLVLATQRPSVDIITGLIKANFPTRVSFAVSTSVDSRTILDVSGAEKLLGKGDMLFSQNGSAKPVRIQGVFASRQEVNKVVSYLKSKYGGAGSAIKGVLEEMPEEEEGGGESDQLFEEAVKTVIRHRQASTSLLTPLLPSACSP